MTEYSLKYIGPGDWLSGVPASDHTAEYTQERVGQLLDSGLYELAGGTAPRKRKKDTGSATVDAPAADAAVDKG